MKVRTIINQVITSLRDSWNIQSWDDEWLSTGKLFLRLKFGFRLWGGEARGTAWLFISNKSLIIGRQITRREDYAYNNNKSLTKTRITKKYRKSSLFFAENKFGCRPGNQGLGWSRLAPLTPAWARGSFTWSTPHHQDSGNLMWCAVNLSWVHDQRNPQPWRGKWNACRNHVNISHSWAQDAKNRNQAQVSMVILK